jgi:hypothetical protein
MRKKTPQEAERAARASQWNNPALRIALRMAGRR